MIGTANQSLQFQQNLARSSVGLLVLAAPSNVLEDLRPLVPNILAEIPRVRAGSVVHVHA